VKLGRVEQAALDALGKDTLPMSLVAFRADLEKGPASQALARLNRKGLVKRLRFTGERGLVYTWTEAGLDQCSERSVD
jgi:DNA-binding MarR family transcriptional regulator